MKPAAERLSTPASLKVGTYRNRVPMAAEEREQLILEHLPQVRLIARRIHDRLPESVSLDDLISTGIVGSDLGHRPLRFLAQREAEDLCRV